LYSFNRFFIFYSHHGSFDRLRALSPTALASLTSLKIVLNESCRGSTCTWCDSYHDELTHDDFQWAAKHHCAKKSGGQHRRPLLDSTPRPEHDLAAFTSAKQEVQAMMAEWHDTVTYLSSHIGIRRLELSLVSDVDPEHPYALEAARLALAPISLLPSLRECHVRLSKSPSFPLQQMAQGAVLHACGRASPAQLARSTPAHRRLL
jgi:hypothetical protein